MARSANPILELSDVRAVYEGIISSLRGVSITVSEGEIVALLGANGAGKSTTLKAASGLLPAERGAITSGDVRLRGQSLLALGARERVQAGVAQVLEGRHCFTHLTVHENLLSGTLARRVRRRELGQQIEQIYELFPRLRARQKSHAGYLSGGEQQMLAIGRALLARPQLILLDEPSMGLAPQIVEEIFEIIVNLNRTQNVSVLLAEQNATVALAHAHHGYVLESGRVVAEGSAAELSARADVKEFYLGVRDDQRRGFRALKQTVRAHGGAVNP